MHEVYTGIQCLFFFMNLNEQHPASLSSSLFSRRICYFHCKSTQCISSLWLTLIGNALYTNCFSETVSLSFCFREDLNKIPYTTMCIKESLRLCPPVPGISRKLTKPMTFFDGRTIPEGNSDQPVTVKLQIP